MKIENKITLTAIISILVIISSIFYSTTILKEKAVDNHKENIQLHVSIFTEQLSQTLTNLNLTIDNLAVILDQESLLQKRINSILSKNPNIRSVNILNNKSEIIYSSNSVNIGKEINLDKYYPKPMFNNSILRFGDAKRGRDLFREDKHLSYVPLLRTITKNDTTYNIVITLNNDYFINRYLTNLNKEKEYFEIIRIDGVLLSSTHQNAKIGTKIKQTKLFEKSVTTSLSSGVELIGNTKYILAYQLTETFPLCVSVQLDYKKTMKTWEDTNELSLIFITILIALISFVIIKLILNYAKAKEKEIEYQKIQIINQDKIKNAYIVYKNTNDGIVITDADANILDVNKAFIINSGYTIDEVYGKNPKILKSELYDENFYKNMWEKISLNNYWHGEIVNRNKFGKLYTELLTINTVLDEEGNIKNYIGVFTNITKQKEQAQEIKEKEQFIFQQSKMASMGEMLENIAHQWRQPLSVISTAATGMKMEKEFNLLSEQDEMDRLTLINDSAQHLSKTIDDFRNFFKPNKFKEEFSLSDAVFQSLNIVSSKFKNRNIEIVENIQDIKITGYKSEVIQVIMNILNNAKDVLDSQKEDEKFIFINIYQENECAILSIKDTGGGIDKVIIDKIFEPYFTTKHQSQGTGIGLYMSEEIISKHMNGTLLVENDTFIYEDKDYVGANFIIKLPLS